MHALTAGVEGSRALPLWDRHSRTADEWWSFQLNVWAWGNNFSSKGTRIFRIFCRFEMHLENAVVARGAIMKCGLKTGYRSENLSNVARDMRQGRAAMNTGFLKTGSFFTL